MTASIFFAPAKSKTIGRAGPRLAFLLVSIANSSARVIFFDASIALLANGSSLGRADAGTRDGLTTCCGCRRKRIEFAQTRGAIYAGGKNETGQSFDLGDRNLKGLESRERHFASAA
jgi:hypothetical protein